LPVFKEIRGMSYEQAPAVSCASCGCALQPRDVVIVIREIPPPWASPTEPTTTIVHRACEPGGPRADYNWTREAPQTLLHILATRGDGRRGELATRETR